MLEANDIALSFNGSVILNSLNIKIGEGELVGLIGPNGAGKTSLLRILANLQTPNTGSVQLDGKNLSDINRKKLAQTIGYLEQGAPAHWPLQVCRLIELGRLPYLSPWEKLSSLDSRIVNWAMNQAEVQHLSTRIVSTLSGGERLRVLIARMFATEPNIILADEPIAALDPYHQLHIMELFRNHCDRGGSTVVVMHDLNMAARFCHRLALLHQGHIVCEGSPEQVLQPQQLRDVYGIQAELHHHTSGLIVLPQARVN
ncbi:MAG: ABC transporter ATP-binding protein [Pseudomonadales bacterium]